MNWAVTHLPHLLPPIVAFLAMVKMGLWAAEQPPSHFTDEEVAAWEATMARRRAARHRRVRPGVAKLGTLALTPLVVAVVTGLFIYTWNLRGDRPSAALIWAHTVTSLLGLSLASAKIALVGLQRLRASTTVRRPQEAFSSVVLLALGLPLLLTGAWLLVRPSGSSTTDYVHLIVSVWWTVLVQWHLWRYLGRALAATFRPPRPADEPAGAVVSLADGAPGATDRAPV